MILFTDKRLFLKGTNVLQLKNKRTGDIKYFSDKFNTASITTELTQGEIRAGLTNPICAMIPTDAGFKVDFSAADFSLFAKAAQQGAKLSYNAPVPACQNVTASSETLTVDVSEGTPVAELGFRDIRCYVQEVGAASPIVTGGVAYSLNPTTGAVAGFTATSGKTYKVWYFVNMAQARLAAFSTAPDPATLHMTAQLAVYANDSGSATNEGTRVGWLYIIVPSLKLSGDSGVAGDQTNNDTTKITGQALAYDPEVIDEDTGEGMGVGSDYAYYLYVPCENAEAIQGLALVGGVVSLPVSTVKQADFRLVLADGSLVKPDPAKMNFEMTTAIAGTEVSSAGVITAGNTAGDGELTATYTDGTISHTCIANVSVTSA